MADGGSVFISHTSELADYPPDQPFVGAAVQAVLNAGLRPVDMAQFPAWDDPPAEYCQQVVRACGVYLAVIGFQYGSRVPGRADDVSYTELEFLTATEAGLPRLVFFLDDDLPVPRSLVDKDSAAIDGFRDRLRANVMVKTVHTPVELGAAVLYALSELRLDQAGPGAGTRAGRAAGGRRPWMAPPSDQVVERPELGSQLVAALTGPHPGEVGLTTALQGAGGVGNTSHRLWHM